MSLLVYPNYISSLQWEKLNSSFNKLMFCLLSHTSETQVRTARGQSPGIVLILLLPAKTTPQHQDPRAKLAGALPELHGAPKGPLLPPPVAPTPRTTAEKHLYGKQGLSTSGTKPSRLQITPRIKPTALTVASKALGHPLGVSL